MTNENPDPRPPVPEETPNRLRRGIAGLGRRVSGGIRTARDGAARLIERAPETMHAARAGSLAVTSSLQALPDSTLRWLAAASVGVGAGLSLRRAPRAIVAAGVVPALVIGAAIAMRPAGTADVPAPAG